MFYLSRRDLLKLMGYLPCLSFSKVSSARNTNSQYKSPSYRFLLLDFVGRQKTRVLAITLDKSKVTYLEKHIDMRRGHSTLKLDDQNLIAIPKSDSVVFWLDQNLNTKSTIECPPSYVFGGHGCFDSKNQKIYFSLIPVMNSKLKESAIMVWNTQSNQMSDLFSSFGRKAHDIAFADSDKASIWISNYYSNKDPSQYSSNYNGSRLSKISTLDGNLLQSKTWDQKEGTLGHFSVANDQVIGAFQSIYKKDDQKPNKTFMKLVNPRIGADIELSKPGKIVQIAKTNNASINSDIIGSQQELQMRPQSVSYNPIARKTCITFTHSNSIAFVGEDGTVEYMHFTNEQITGPRGAVALPGTHHFALTGTKGDLMILDSKSQEILKTLKFQLNTHSHLQFG